jgi:hypothetical protein
MPNPPYPNKPVPGAPIPRPPQPTNDYPRLFQDIDFNPLAGRGDYDTWGSAAADTLSVRPARYTNTPAGLTFSTDSGERYIVSPTGQAQPLAGVLQNLARTLRTGGTPGATQRAIINAMSPAQQRAAGIFLAPDGTVKPFREVLTAAVANAAAGRSLSTNQHAALGLA